jgi:DNA polymerase-3 subunit beta
MKIHIHREQFIDLVGNLSRVVLNNAHVQALQGIRLEVIGSILTCVATNIEMSIRTELTGENAEDGVCLVPARVLLDVLKNSRGEKVECVAKEGVLFVSTVGGKSQAKTKITLLPVGEFLMPDMHTTQTTHSIVADIFVQGFQNTLFAVSPSTIKPELACISVQHKEGVLTFVATDSFRLAEKKVPYQGEEEVPSLLLPGKNAGELVYFLNKMGENEVLWYFEDKMLAVRAGDYYITTRLVVGTYPDYTRIIPKEYSSTAQFITSDLQYVFRKAALFNDTTRQISVELVPERNECLFRAKNSTVGEFEESIPARIIGDSLGLNFNSKYISDCLGYIKEEGVECKFAGPGRPLVMKGVNNESFLYLVMPMNR